MPVGKTESDVTEVLDLALHAQMEPTFFFQNCIPPGSFVKCSPLKVYRDPGKEAGESLPLPSFFRGL